MAALLAEVFEAVAEDARLPFVAQDPRVVENGAIQTRLRRPEDDAEVVEEPPLDLRHDVARDVVIAGALDREMSITARIRAYTETG